MKIINQILNFSRNKKILILILNDLTIIFFSCWAAFFLRIDNIYITKNLLLLFAISCSIHIPIFFLFNNYFSINRFFSIKSIEQIIIAMTCYSVILLAIILYIHPSGIPRTLSIIQPSLLFLFIILSRITISYIANIQKELEERNNILIYGAGKLGFSALSFINSTFEYKVSGFLDDDKNKIGKMIGGYRIYNIDEIENRFNINHIKKIIIAIDKLSKDEKEKIILSLEKLNIEVNFIDSTLLSDKNKTFEQSLRNINLDDLVKKKNIKIPKIYNKIENETILVSGAGGSIGSELVCQILQNNPKEIILLDHSEFNLYQINLKSKKIIDDKKLNVHLIPLLVSVTNYERLESIFKTYQPSQVFHAAAYKHVSMVEKNPNDSIRNNVIGTKNIADVSLKYGVSRFLFISTDKAVRPSTLMGKTKRIGEKYIQALSFQQEKSKTFTIVRFGNVMGSSGSVIPLFIDQINNGGPITLTHKDVKRYFMTISDAVSLVLEASQNGEGGEIFVLDMGEPIKVLDIAEKLIKLSGKTIKDTNNLKGDIEIEITGLDEYEKISEELMISDTIKKTSNEYIMEVDNAFQDISSINKDIEEMNSYIKTNDSSKLLKIVNSLILK